jgi:hypothetical protein
MRTALVATLAALSLLVSLPSSADWDESQPSKWVQMPEDGLVVGLHVNVSTPYIVADDFPCAETGRLTDIHIWGGWYQSAPPPDQVTFTLSIHEDIPAEQSPTGYSMPGDVLWTGTFPPGSFVVQEWSTPAAQGWLNPPSDYIPFSGSGEPCYQYNFFIDPADAFIQEGTPAHPVVYWLDVQADPVDPGESFGWKVFSGEWNDDAVWGQGEEPYTGDWFDLVYPEGHPYSGQSIDMAFVVNSEAVEIDWGDAPDPGYPTLSSSNGANHMIAPGYFMGAGIDAEPDGQPDPHALGDDNNGSDDEDGVASFPPLIHGMPATIEVAVSAPGFIDAWIDFNLDGSWAEAGDQIAAAVPAAPPMTSITFTVPTTAGFAIETFARFRFSSVGGLPYDGPAPDGEVEDYSGVRLEGNHTYKWVQPPDLSTLGIDVEASDSYLLADDFLCNESGPIMDIHIWGSWNEEYFPFGDDPGAVSFTLSIHEDIPADSSATGYSHPGNILWVKSFPVGTFFYREWQTDLQEGWYTPGGSWYWPSDFTCFRYDFYIDESEAFYQEGTPADPVVYWLDLQAYPEDPGAHFGWKTSQEHWNDDAVWGLGAEPYYGNWGELRYPQGHDQYGESIDLAFMVTGGPVVEFLDYGDAPEPNYPTRLASDGARHPPTSPILVLGSFIDTEADGQPNSTATGDDLADFDDEDGVEFTRQPAPGSSAEIDVTVGGGSGLLDAWIDFYANGDWDDPVDQIFASEPLTSGKTSLTYSVPSDAVLGPTFARFRISTAGGLPYDGPADDGEVEDYEVEIVELDWGDAPTPYRTLFADGGPSHVLTPGMYLGNGIDAEADGQPDPLALGDDLAGIDDEDGVTFPEALIPGKIRRVVVVASTPGLLDAWIDFQGDGGFWQPIDQVFASKPLSTGPNLLRFLVPPVAQPGTAFARFRFSTAGGLRPFGPADDGEVEDHTVEILQAPDNKWLQSPDLDPTGIDVNATTNLILADDFLCQYPGRVTEIYIWGSWLYDQVPTDPVTFTLSIHEDVPDSVSPTGYSIPGDLLWIRTFGPGDYTVQPWEDGIEEGWFDPSDDFYIFPADTTCWLYTFTIEPQGAFHQVGTPMNPTTYWLDLQVGPDYPGYEFGWKTSLDHWNDDAVWGIGGEPFAGDWFELIYPPDHGMAGESIDLAFAIRTTYGAEVPEEEIPSGFGMEQNVPNPFNPGTTIRFQAPVGGGHVTLRVYDVSGRVVATLVDEQVTEGRHTVTWAGVSDDGLELPSGVYFYRLETKEGVTTRKMLLLK